MSPRTIRKVCMVCGETYGLETAHRALCGRGLTLAPRPGIQITREDVLRGAVLVALLLGIAAGFLAGYMIGRADLREAKAEIQEGILDEARRIMVEEYGGAK